MFQSTIFTLNPIKKRFNPIFTLNQIKKFDLFILWFYHMTIKPEKT